MFRRRLAWPVHFILTASVVFLTLMAAARPASVAAASGLSGTLSASWSGKPSAAHPGDTITYTATITNTGAASPADDASNVTFTDTPDSNTTIVPNSLEVSPIARPDFYTAYGNVPITIGASTGTTGVLANDNDSDGDTVTITGADTRSANEPGGAPVNVSMNNATGGFTYTPPAGFVGTDSFHYTLSDGTSTDQGTVYVTVSGMIWFIDNSQGSNGDGRLTTPFNNVASFNSINDGATNHGQNNDVIFLYDTSASSYTGPLVLRSGQKLIGQAASQSVQTIASITLPPGSASLPSNGGTKSTMTAASGNDTVDVNSNNTIRGINLANTGTGNTVGMSGSLSTSYGTLTMLEENLSNTGGGPAMNVGSSPISGTLSATFGTVTATGGAANGVMIKNTTGSFSSSGGSINSTTGDGAHFEGQSSASPITVTLSSMTFTGDDSTASNSSCDDVGNTCNAVIFLSNASNVSLSSLTMDGLNGSSHAQEGIYGTGVNGFTFSGGEIKRIGYPTQAGSCASNINVCYVESGMLFNNLTGTATINNGANIHDNGGQDLEFRNNVSGTLNLTVSGVTLGTIGDGTGTGTDSGRAAIFVRGDGASTPVMNLDVEGTTMGTSVLPLDGYGIDASNLFTSGVNSNAHMNFKIGVTSANSIFGNKKRGVGIDISEAGSGRTTFDIENNTVKNTGASDINVNLADPPAGGNNNSGTLLGGTIRNNIIGTSGSAGSAGNGNGIQLWPNNVGNFTVLVTGNQIYGTSGDGIQVQTTESPTVNATITGNTIDEDNSGNHADIFLQNGRSSVTTDGATLCADVGGSGVGNTLSNSVNFAGGGFAIHTEQDSLGAFSLPGLPAGSYDSSVTGNQTGVANYLIGRNTFGLVNGVAMTTGKKAFDRAGSLSLTPAQTGGYVNTSSSSPCAAAPALASDLTRVAHPVSSSNRLPSRGPGQFATTTKGAERAHSSGSRSMDGFIHPMLANLTSGTGFNVGTLPAGHTVTLTFQATINNSISANSVTNSATMTDTQGNSVNPAPSASTPVSIATTKAVGSSANPSNAGDSVTFTATITNTAGTATPTGTINFKSDGTTITSPSDCSAVTLSGSTTSATAQCSTAALAVGSHTITAEYTPTSGTGFTSGTGTLSPSQQVNAISTTTGVQSSKNPANSGDTVTFTATVSQSTNSLTPAGTVAFSSDASAITCEAGSNTTLSGSGNSATATCEISTLSVGTHQITASYTPANTNFNSSSTASALSQEIDALPTITLDSASDTGTSNSDGITKINKPKFNGTAQKGVSITVLDGASTYCTTAADATTGAWTCTGASALADGTHSITASAGNAGGTVTTSALSVTIDTVVPNMALFGTTSSAGTTQKTVNVQDPLSGLANITVTKCINCTSYSVNGTTKNPPFTFPDSNTFTGTTSVVQVVSNYNSSQTSTLGLASTDIAGNQADPTVLVLGRSSGSQVAAVVPNVQQQESQIDVFNAIPGITTLMVTVNGHVFQFRNLTSGQKFSFSIASALKPGNGNQIAVVGIGPKNSSATLFIGPAHK